MRDPMKIIVSRI